MAIVRWDPWTTLPSLQDRINRIFEEAFPRGAAKDTEFAPADWRPAVDTYEEGNNIVIMPVRIRLSSTGASIMPINASCSASSVRRTSITSSSTSSSSIGVGCSSRVLDLPALGRPNHFIIAPFLRQHTQAHTHNA